MISKQSISNKIRSTYVLKALFVGAMLLLPYVIKAQVGEHRNTLSIGVNGGYDLTTIRFSPKVVQSMKGGFTVGLTARYTVEKYFSTIASVQAEVNFAQLGWKEDIQTINNTPVINSVTGVAEKYERTINYVQIPFMTHLAWGKEDKGLNFFVNAGPQFGFYLGESTSTNFDFATRNTADRANNVAEQETMSVQKKFDYGITAGLGMEYAMPRVGRFLMEARYYYGLGNIYRDSKKDYFGSSNFSTITVKMAYLFDIMH